jgi:hypothetical protein
MKKHYLSGYGEKLVDGKREMVAIKTMCGKRFDTLSEAKANGLVQVTTWNRYDETGAYCKACQNHMESVSGSRILTGRA